MSRLTDEQLDDAERRAKGWIKDDSGNVVYREIAINEELLALDVLEMATELRARRSADRDLATVLVDHRLLSPDVKLEDAVALIARAGLSDAEVEVLRHIAGQLRRHELRTPTEDRALAALSKLLGER